MENNSTVTFIMFVCVILARNSENSTIPTKYISSTKMLERMQSTERKFHTNPGTNGQIQITSAPVLEQNSAHMNPNPDNEYGETIVRSTTHRPVTVIKRSTKQVGNRFTHTSIIQGNTNIDHITSYNNEIPSSQTRQDKTAQRIIKINTEKAKLLSTEVWSSHALYKRSSNYEVASTSAPMSQTPHFSLPVRSTLQKKHFVTSSIKESTTTSPLLIQTSNIHPRTKDYTLETSSHTVSKTSTDLLKIHQTLTLISQTSQRFTGKSKVTHRLTLTTNSQGKITQMEKKTESQQTFSTRDNTLYILTSNMDTSLQPSKRRTKSNSARQGIQSRSQGAGTAVAAIIGSCFICLLGVTALILYRKKKAEQKRKKNSNWAGPSPFLDGQIINQIPGEDDVKLNRTLSKRISLGTFISHRISKHFPSLLEQEQPQTGLELNSSFVRCSSDQEDNVKVQKSTDVPVCSDETETFNSFQIQKGQESGSLEDTEKQMEKSSNSSLILTNTTNLSDMQNTVPEKQTTTNDNNLQPTTTGESNMAPPQMDLIQE
ncbi:uncharacterized protein LOC120531351 [Polypterus senegalus]|uniref:uncharacterized protein LOC120531351 n=1 Tax=Polypterus senegalus TaxID=55291 RepID=UPI0019655E1F|nr:uncharacterized protein LOC120531351 [Polypterus senegalus]XP_039612602.1 uncharacterized protein LOC120531351 [Polypterus senegalus]